MKKNLTEMVFILDRSGSMGNLTSDTIGGFNSMIAKQKDEQGEAYVTTVLFDDQYEVLHDHIDINEISPMTNKEYFARGCTALLDAIGKSINSIGARINEEEENVRPDKVVFIITTDGFENSSKEFTRQKIKEMIKHQQEKYSWTFMFLGANIDAVREAASLGINTDFAKTYTASDIGTQSVFTSMSKAMSCARGIDFNTKDASSASYKAVVDALDEIE